MRAIPPGLLYCAKSGNFSQVCLVITAFSSGAPSVRTWACWSESRGGHGDDQGAGAPLLGVKVVQPGEEKAPGRPYSGLPVPKGTYKKAAEGLFTRACGDRTRGNGFKLTKGRFTLDIRKKFFTMRAVRHWHRLPRAAVNAPSLELFKARLDGAGSNLGWWKVSAGAAGTR